MTDERRSVPTLVAAAVLVVAVVVGVVLFGVYRPPELTNLTAQPEPAPPGRLAWLDTSGQEQCLVVAERDGRVREPWCERAAGVLVGWDEAGVVLHRWDAGDRLEVVDPDTGDRSMHAADPADSPAPPDHGRAVRTEYRDGVLTVVELQGDTAVWATEAPDVYDVTDGIRSPDGQWLALVDTAERLLLVPADGSRPPRVWSDRMPRWTRPVWEGTPAG